ncbi:hypothetical protein ABFA25_12115 [Mycobacterium lepromatosis]
MAASDVTNIGSAIADATIIAAGVRLPAMFAAGVDVVSVSS